MAEFRTDEENFELIKRWWKDNAASLLITVAVALAAVFGYRAWQDYQQDTLGQLAEEYDKYLQTLNAAGDGTVENRAFLLNQLKERGSASAYAAFAAFFEAQRLVEASNMDGAATELQWVINADMSSHLKDVARFRLARVLHAQGKFTQAKETLNAITPAGVSAELDELRGDIAMAEGKQEEARTAYQRAASAADAQQSPLLQMKLDDLASASAQANADE